MKTPDTITIKTTDGRPLAFYDYSSRLDDDSCGVVSDYFRALVAIDAGGSAKLAGPNATADDWALDRWPTISAVPEGWTETEIEDHVRHIDRCVYHLRACYPPPTTETEDQTMKTTIPNTWNLSPSEAQRTAIIPEGWHEGTVDGGQRILTGPDGQRVRVCHNGHGIDATGNTRKAVAEFMSAQEAGR